MMPSCMTGRSKRWLVAGLLGIISWWPAWLAAEQAGPRVIALRITTETQPVAATGWEGWATYDILELQLVATWSDGRPDPDCTRAENPPRWTTDYGWFEAPKRGLERLCMAVAEPTGRFAQAMGSRVLWSSSFGEDGQGTIRASYGGLSAAFAVRARKPTMTGSPKMPPDYFAEFVAPVGYNYVEGMMSYLFLPDRGGRRSEMLRLMNLTAEEKRQFHDQQRRQAQEVSDRLSVLIRQWWRGDRRPVELPAGMLPESLQNYKTRWVLVHPDQISPEDQWIARPASQVPADLSRLTFGAADPHITYLILEYLAPFGSTLVISGQYPQCRLFSMQVSPPFDPEFPSYVGVGVGEVPIVDVDIEPEPGSTNPFRVGADRHAADRFYHVYFRMAQGNAVALNEALNPGSMTPVGPAAYRTPQSRNNTRVGGPVRASGIFAQGALMPGMVWVRYVAPDHRAGPLGGVPLPAAHFVLATGERFWLLPRGVRLFARRNNIPVPALPTPDAKPDRTCDTSRGWQKQFGINWAINASLIQGWTWWNEGGMVQEALKSRLRDLGRILENRGPDAPPPGNFEASARASCYTHYTLRPTTCGAGHVVVLTGRLPKTPKTRHGQSPISRGELRYFSITHYLPFYGSLQDPLYPLTCYGSLMDDEIVPIGRGPSGEWFIIVYSRREDRPRNATPQHGVTWQDWGPSSQQSITVRWTSVMPDWHAPWVPDANNMPWSKADWAQPRGQFDPNLLYRNTRDCCMKEHHILVHYMTREAFEALTPAELLRRTSGEGS